MYHVLIVDDEPLICQGLIQLLAESGLNIGKTFAAHSSFEALDTLRLEPVDLMITDIQMSEMNGIELIQLAKMDHPGLAVIVISAHEDFQYAQAALRLGAKDYLVKPLDPAKCLDVIRNELLKLEKYKEPQPIHDVLTTWERKSFSISEPNREGIETLEYLLTNETAVPCEMWDEDHTASKYRFRLAGPYYSILRLKPLPEKLLETHRSIARDDLPLFQYAALNIVYECLNGQLHHTTYRRNDDEIITIIGWSESEYEEKGVSKINMLDMIARTLFINIENYLRVSCLVGMSQILKGLQFLPELNRQSEEALKWHEVHTDNHIFYYGDFLHYSRQQGGSTAPFNDIVEQARAYIHSHYGQKGLTLHEVAQNVHVSPNYLSYLFKKYMGKNLWEYVIQLRMEASKTMLLTTDLRRYEISEKVGYESPEHFSKIFKKYFGVSPSQIKK